MSVESIYEKGLKLHRRRSTRQHAVSITDIDFTDDIALISQSLQHAQDLLQSLEQASNGVGLYLNETKTECMSRCHSNNYHPVRTLNGNENLLKLDKVSLRIIVLELEVIPKRLYSPEQDREDNYTKLRSTV